MGFRKQPRRHGMIASMTSSLNIEEPLTSGIPDALSMLRPASEADYRKIELEIRRQRATWVGHLRVALPDPSGRRVTAFEAEKIPRMFDRA